MSKYYSLRIPEPCHEDWNLMSPKDKGRFCNSCSKVVVDFTLMKDQEIKDFLQENQDKKLCGHIYKSQLDSIHIKIPSSLLSTHRVGKYSFLLVLLVVMGTTLFSCKDHHGKNQKIDRVEIIDSMIANEEEVPIMGGFASQLEPVTDCTLSTKDNNQMSVADSIVKKKDSPSQQIDQVIDGEMIVVVGEIDVSTEQESYTIWNVDEKPKFPNTPVHLSEAAQKKYFQDKLQLHFDTNFKIKPSLEINDPFRIYVRFTINASGKLENVQARAQYKELVKEAKRVLSLLPRLEPAKVKGKSVDFVYTLPISFNNMPIHKQYK